MSAKLMGQVWELDLQHGEQLVMLALADHGEDDGSQIFPSVARLAWKTGYKERQVQNILRTLTDKGLIEPVANAQGGRGHATEYKMNIEKGAKKTPFIKGAKSERVQSATQKGAKSSIKGAIAIAPQPSYNHQETSYIAADAAPPQKPANPSKKKATSRQTPIQPEAVMVPPPPPVAPEQAAADLAAWDALESASGRELPPPTGTSKDAIERALILACVPSGERREIAALMPKIRAAGKVIREGDICTADDIMTRCVGRGSLFYTTHFAEDGDGGLTTPPTPQTIAAWIWKLEERRSKRWTPFMTVLTDPTEQIRRAIEQNQRITGEPPVTSEPTTRRLSRFSLLPLSQTA